MMKGKGGPSGGAGGDQAQAEDAAPEEESSYSPQPLPRLIVYRTSREEARTSQSQLGRRHVWR